MTSLSVKISLLSLFLALVISPVFSTVQAAETSASLRSGSREPVVKLIQYILNLDPATKVATSGEGSLGQETEYFGPRTVLAVYKFQKKYGITGETGRIDLQTLKMMVYLAPKMMQAQQSRKSVIPTDWPEAGAVTTVRAPIKSYSTSVITRPTRSTVAPVVKLATPKLYSLSPSMASNNQAMTIYGEGFTKTGNNIVTKFKAINSVASADGRTLTFNFSMPMSSEALNSINSLPSGVISSLAVPVSLYVTNNGGVSNELTFSYRIK